MTGCRSLTIHKSGRLKCLDVYRQLWPLRLEKERVQGRVERKNTGPRESRDNGIRHVGIVWHRVFTMSPL